MDSGEQIFLRVVEAGSLKAAAEQLGADPSSVSRKVAALEARLGVKLLARSTRRSTPTEAGALYYEGLRRLLDEQAALEAQVAGEVDIPRGLLRVTAPVDFGALFVAPVLKQMQRDYPRLQVELLLGTRFADLGEEGIDVAVRIGQLPDSSLICRRLGEVPRVLVASRDYLARRGEPRRPRDLAEHEFIFYTRASAQAPIELTGPGGPEQVPVSGGFTVNSIAAIRELVEAGQGVHLGPVWAFREGLEAGRLLRLLPEWRLPAYPLHALYTSTSFVPAKIRQFIDRMAAGEARSWENRARRA